ncbi:MAG TPA: hypothetical protein VFB58_13595 [Chloroflexota bacterium]|nr:hypothetical protein [Chloroflexota bacterium]
MPRKSDKDAVQKAQKRLDRALLDLHAAQEERSEAIRQGEQDVKDAQERAARRLQKATERVERRTAVVSQARERLHDLTGESGP